MADARASADVVEAQEKGKHTSLCWLQNSPRESPGMLKEAKMVQPPTLQ